MTCYDLIYYACRAVFGTNLSALRDKSDNSIPQVLISPLDTQPKQRIVCYTSVCTYRQSSFHTSRLSCIAMAPTSLRRMCTNAAIRNLKRIDEDGLGDAPWELLKPIVNKCEDPRMLHAWEISSPQIQGETGEIWLKFIKRDVPNWRNKTHEPKNPKNWFKVYRNLKAEADLEEKQAEEMLKQRMSKIKKDESTWKVAPPTKAIPERNTRNKGVAMQFHRGSDNNGLRFTTGTKTKDFMQAARRQAAESKLQKTGVLARPSNMLNNGMAPRKIAQAPQHMVEDRQRQADAARQNAQRASGASTSKGRSTAPMSLAARAADDLRAREERLRAVREGRVVPKQSSPPTDVRSSPAAKSSARAERKALPVASVLGNDKPERKASPVKPQSGFDESRTGTVSSTVTGTPSSGAKRKVGPSILLPMKRSKK